MPSEEDFRALRAVMQTRLEELRAQISSELGSQMTEHYRDIAGEVVDSADEAVGAELAGLENAAIGRNVAEVRDLEAALDRLAKGNYGYCIDCRSEIELARLQAYPTCKRCEPCQRAYEHTYAGMSHPSL